MEFKKLSEMKKNYDHCKAGKNNIIIDLHELESNLFISKVLDDIKPEIMATIGRDTVESLAFFLKAEPEDKEIYIDLEFHITHVYDCHSGKRLYTFKSIAGTRYTAYQKNIYGVVPYGEKHCVCVTSGTFDNGRKLYFSDVEI